MAIVSKKMHIVYFTLGEFTTIILENNVQENIG